MSTEEIITKHPRLDRNAQCPICGKYYHNIDVHNNPIPNAKNKRPDESLCQCAKGEDARFLRRAVRMEREEAKKAKERHKKDILSMRTRNIAYWKDKEVTN